MDEPLAAHSFNEGRYYLMVTACGECGKGPWEIDSTDPAPPGAGRVTAHARCRHCERDQDFRFLCETGDPADGARGEQINPTDEPSRIIDLSQWLSLFYMLIESGASADQRTATRHTGLRAALCLAEGLKFYTDDELPDESAFFTEKSLAVFREHPEKFARQRLRDMQSKLPALPRMERSVDRDERGQGKRWWEFWK